MKKAMRSSPKGHSKVKAVLFDLDGVLVNMPDGHYEALNRALGLFGTKIERDEHFSEFNGLPTRVKIERLEKQNRLPTGLRDFVNGIKQKYTKDIIPQYCRPDYSKIMLLSHLKSVGLKLGCCSNSVSETLHLMLKSANLFDFFDVIIGNDEVKKPKPHPEIYKTAVKRLNLLPHECIIVEDSPHGVQSASKSGGKVIIVRNVEDVHLSLFDGLI